MQIIFCKNLFLTNQTRLKFKGTHIIYIYSDLIKVILTMTQRCFNFQSKLLQKKKFQSKLNMSLIRKKNCVPNIQLLFFFYENVQLPFSSSSIYIYIYIYFNQNVQLMEWEYYICTSHKIKDSPWRVHS